MPSFKMMRHNFKLWSTSMKRSAPTVVGLKSGVPHRVKDSKEKRIKAIKGEVRL